MSNASLARLMIENPCLSVAAGQESSETFRRRQIRELMDLLRDAHLFMDARNLPNLERGLLSQLQQLAAEARKRIQPDARAWLRVHDRLQEESKVRRERLSVLETLD